MYQFTALSRCMFKRIWQGIHVFFLSFVLNDQEVKGKRGRTAVRPVFSKAKGVAQTLLMQP